MNQDQDNTPAPGPFDWLFTSATEWGRLMIAAQEVRGSDEECFDALQGHAAVNPPPSRDHDKLPQDLMGMLNALRLSPENVAESYPSLMDVLGRACTSCGQKARCEQELRQQTASENHPEFCPNTERLNALLRVAAARQNAA